MSQIVFVVADQIVQSHCCCTIVSWLPTWVNRPMCSSVRQKNPRSLKESARLSGASGRETAGPEPAGVCVPSGFRGAASTYIHVEAAA